MTLPPPRESAGNAPRCASDLGCFNKRTVIIEIKLANNTNKNEEHVHTMYLYTEALHKTLTTCSQ